MVKTVIPSSIVHHTASARIVNIKKFCFSFYFKGKVLNKNFENTRKRAMRETTTQQPTKNSQRSVNETSETTSLQYEKKSEATLVSQSLVRCCWTMVLYGVTATILNSLVSVRFK